MIFGKHFSWLIFLFIYGALSSAVWAVPQKSKSKAEKKSTATEEKTELSEIPLESHSNIPFFEYLQLVDSLVPNSKFGMSVRSVKTGKELGNIRGKEFFIPASTLKTLTTATALFHLPLQYEPQTFLYLDGSIQKNVFRGTLRIRGEGDPNISGRYYPDALHFLKIMADSLKAFGIDSIIGNIELDTSFYSGPRRPEHWASHFYNAWYGAEVTPLQFNDNCTLIRLKPGKNVGDTATVYAVPDVGFVRIENKLTTTTKRKRRYTWALHDTEPIITIGGTIGIDLDSAQIVLPVRNPVAYFRSALLKAFAESNLQFTESSETPRGIEIKRFAFSAAPLLSLLDEINQRSQNLHAETLFRNMGQKVVGQGNVDGGKQAEKLFLKQLGIPFDDFEIYDGSGLSAKNKVKPSTETALLAKMARSARGDLYIQSLASPEIGTGTKRMKDIPRPSKVRFKTGFIGSVHALAGYIFTPYDTLAVATYLNETGKTNDEICKNALDSVWTRLFNLSNSETLALAQAKRLWINALNIDSTENRLRYFSEVLKGTPYLLGPTGEGICGKIDSKPTIRLDSVDCVTFIENVLALTLAPHEDSVFSTLQKIRYLDGEISFLKRKHYFVNDWILKDSFAHLIPVPGDTVIQRTLPKQKFFADKGFPNQKDETLSLRFLPLEKAKQFAQEIWLGNPEFRGIAYVFNGNAVDVFHTGFLILNPGEKPIFRHASQIEKQVTDISLEDYLNQSKKKIPGIVQFKF